MVNGENGVGGGCPGRSRATIPGIMGMDIWEECYLYTIRCITSLCCVKRWGKLWGVTRSWEFLASKVVERQGVDDPLPNKSKSTTEPIEVSMNSNNIMCVWYIYLWTSLVLLTYCLDLIRSNCYHQESEWVVLSYHREHGWQEWTIATAVWWILDEPTLVLQSVGDWETIKWIRNCPALSVLC